MDGGYKCGSRLINRGFELKLNSANFPCKCVEIAILTNIQASAGYANTNPNIYISYNRRENQALIYRVYLNPSLPSTTPPALLARCM